MSDENQELYEYVAGRKKYADSRADYHLWRFDVGAMLWMLGAAYFFAGAPWSDGEPMFKNVPDWVYLTIGSLTAAQGGYILWRVLGTRTRHNQRSARKTMRDLTGDEE